MRAASPLLVVLGLLVVASAIGASVSLAPAASVEPQAAPPLSIPTLPLSPQAPPAAEEPRAFPFERGINVDAWARYALPDDSIGPRDLRLMRELGFTYVRLPVGPQLYERDGHLDAAAMERLDAKLDMILAADLAVLVDMHPPDGYGDPVLRGGEAQDRYVSFLRELAAALSSRDPSRVALEMMNEPHDPDAGDGVEYDYDAAQLRFWRAARDGAPALTLVATVSHWSGVEGLDAIDLLPDENVVYDVHVYEPFIFTHQGATWTWDVVAPLRGVPYGSSEDAVAPLLDGLAANVRPHVAWYGKQEWQRAKLAEVYDEIDAWAEANGARVVIGEFGVYKKYAPADDRARWVQDARELAEERGMGWAMWDWDRSFAMAERGTGNVDAAIVAALGLRG